MKENRNIEVLHEELSKQYNRMNAFNERVLELEMEIVKLNETIQQLNNAHLEQFKILRSVLIEESTKKKSTEKESPDKESTKKESTEKESPKKTWESVMVKFFENKDEFKGKGFPKMIWSIAFQAKEGRKLSEKQKAALKSYFTEHQDKSRHVKSIIEGVA